jgi:hypothetical protein
MERFVDQRDEAVFEVIVQRHGPLVWGGVPPGPEGPPRCRGRLPRPCPQGGFGGMQLVRITKSLFLEVPQGSDAILWGSLGRSSRPPLNSCVMATPVGAPTLTIRP